VTEEEPADNKEFAKQLGARLRAIRQQQNLSLNAVQELSGGRWKAVVVGSYERGDRALTVVRLAELAAFYDVPVSQIIPNTAVAAPQTARGGASAIVIDLQALRELPEAQVGPLARFAKAIQDQRGDYNNRMLSIRREDVRALSVIYDLGADELLGLLHTWGVLLGETPVHNSYIPDDLIDED
jgi:transcriptional regulator with XRE-family HTH domain